MWFRVFCHLWHRKGPKLSLGQLFEHRQRNVVICWKQLSWVCHVLPNGKQSLKHASCKHACTIVTKLGCTCAEMCCHAKKHMCLAVLFGKQLSHQQTNQICVVCAAKSTTVSVLCTHSMRLFLQMLFIYIDNIFWKFAVCNICNIHVRFLCSYHSYLLRVPFSGGEVNDPTYVGCLVFFDRWFWVVSGIED